MRTALDKKIFLMLFTFSSALYSQEYAEFDANGDGMVDQEEFQEVFRENFSNWDNNRDGILTDQEFYESAFDHVDINADGMLGSTEWDRGFSFVFGDFLGTSHNGQFDLNGDQKISKKEFFASIKFSDFFSFYDDNASGTVDLKEFNEGVFAHWDEDRNQYIEQKEYETFGPYFTIGISEKNK